MSVDYRIEGAGRRALTVIVYEADEYEGELVLCRAHFDDRDAATLWGITNVRLLNAGCWAEASDCWNDAPNLKGCTSIAVWMDEARVKIAGALAQRRGYAGAWMTLERGEAGYDPPIVQVISQGVTTNTRTPLLAVLFAQAMAHPPRSGL